MRLKTALTIAGSDSSGGAGIQADLKAMLANGVFGMSAVTALTAQNTTGVTAVQEASPEFLAAEIDAVFTDIRPDAVKIGMVAAVPLIETIAAKLAQYQAKNVVVDPVMVATSGARLLPAEAVRTLSRRLFPLATIITPNLSELSLLCGRAIHTTEERAAAAQELQRQWGCAVLAKGGHPVDEDDDAADDVLAVEDGIVTFPEKRIDTRNTHGTGCTLSSAIAANLAKGFALSDAVRRAKEYVTGALQAGLALGKGNGPLHHGFDIKSRYAVESVDADAQERAAYLSRVQGEAAAFDVERIAPFLWLDRGDKASVVLDVGGDYQSDLFATRAEDGAEGSSHDWESLAKVFLTEACPELADKLRFDSTEREFRVRSRTDKQALWQFITGFKQALDDRGRILDLFSRAEIDDPFA
ncbi:MAG: bifunctional hydroxymethylpyrimidine kinase/phosphomethylpyrimidine kinase [Schwartzia sp.]|nr:bifunctional hydroxymethylpyrimidine kinase/phosphomethylpyrimidine kinase [Schwartzia sp. (in: firmicutes)]